MAAEDHSDQRSENIPTMVEHSVDELAKGLATGTVSRGKALRMLGATLVGGMLASIPGAAWAAKPGCASGVTCKGKCCAVGATCAKGAGGGCTCPTGQTACNGQCVSLTTNQNCGSCGNACTGAKSCQGGACACPQGQTDCGGVCRDFATDVANCGGCNQACTPPANATATCADGQCGFVCGTGYTAIGNSCCQNAQVCGSSCGCQTGQSCVDGQCVFPDMCDPGSGGGFCGPNPNGDICACRREEVGTGRAVCIERSIEHCRPPCTSTSECPPHTVCVQLVGQTEGHCATLCGEGCPMTTQCCAPGFPSTYSDNGVCENEATVRIICAQSGYCQQTCPEGQTLDLYTCECV